MTREWLDAAAGRLAGVSGGDAAGFALSEADIAALLDVARVAAHESGDRTNAPLATFLVGVALGRSGGDLPGLAAAAAGTGAAGA